MFFSSNLVFSLFEKVTHSSDPDWVTVDAKIEESDGNSVLNLCTYKHSENDHKIQRNMDNGQVVK